MRLPRFVRIILIVACAIAPIFETACREPARPPAAPPVTTRVERRDLVETVSEEGSLGAARTAFIALDIEKTRLLAVHVKEGDLVRKGDLLFEFDPKPVDGELAVIQASSEALKLKIKYLKDHRNGVESIETRRSIQLAEDTLRQDQRQLGVQKQMIELGLAPAAEGEQLAAKTASSELVINLAKSRAEELAKYPETPEIADLETRLLELKNRQREYQEMRARLSGTAPISGRIIKVNDQIKNLADGQGRLPPLVLTSKWPLLAIADIDTIKVSTEFFENDISRISLGQKAEVIAKHVPGKVFPGTVTRIGEFGNPRGQTATLQVEVTVDNREHLLKPGLTAAVQIVMSERHGVPSVPVQVVRHEQGAAFVWRLETDGGRTRVPVRTGASDGRFVEILEGLGEQDVLVME